MDMVPAECFFQGPSSVGKYILTVIVLFLMGAFHFVVMPLTKLVPQNQIPQQMKARAMLPWRLHRVMNSIGGLYQIVYITMTTVALAPMDCPTNPSGQSTVYRFQDVLCGSAEQTAMVVPGMLLLIFAMVYYACVVFLAFIAPRRSKDNQSFLLGIRFLIFKYRLDRWWWCIIPMPRAFLVSLVPVLGGSARSALVYLVMIIGLYALALVHFLPWKAPILNFTDAGSAAILLVIIVFAKAYLPEVANLDKPTYDIIMLISVVSMYSVCGVGVLLAFVSTLVKGLQGKMTGVLGNIAHLRLNTVDMDPKALAARVWGTVVKLPQVGTKAELQQSMQGWQIQDLERASLFLDVLENYGVKGVQLKDRGQGKLVRKGSSRLRFDTGASSASPASASSAASPAEKKAIEESVAAVESVGWM
jgi:hypothetical protein